MSSKQDQRISLRSDYLQRLACSKTKNHTPNPNPISYTKDSRRILAQELMRPSTIHYITISKKDIKNVRGIERKIIAENPISCFTVQQQHQETSQKLRIRFNSYSTRNQYSFFFFHFFKKLYK